MPSDCLNPVATRMEEEVCLSVLVLVGVTLKGEGNLYDVTDFELVGKRNALAVEVNDDMILATALACETVETCSIQEDTSCLERFTTLLLALDCLNGLDGLNLTSDSICHNNLFLCPFTGRFV